MERDHGTKKDLQLGSVGKSLPPMDTGMLPEGTSVQFQVLFQPVGTRPSPALALSGVVIPISIVCIFLEFSN